MITMPIFRKRAYPYQGKIEPVENAPQSEPQGTHSPGFFHTDAGDTTAPARNVTPTVHHTAAPVIEVKPSLGERLAGGLKARVRLKERVHEYNENRTERKAFEKDVKAEGEQYRREAVREAYIQGSMERGRRIGLRKGL